MKLFSRVLLVLALLAAAMLGGYAASRVGAVQAAAAAFGPPIKVTLMDVPNASTTPDVFGTTAVKIADAGTFTVEDGASLIEVTHQGRLYVESFTGSTGAYFELRVDDTLGQEVRAGQPSGLGLVRSTEAGTYVSNTFTGYWQGLTPGEHTVSIWVRAANGTANNAIIDPGGWNSNIVVVKEYLPFGTTFAPLVNR